MNLTRHILATLAMAVAFGAAAIAGDNTLLDVYQSSKEVRKSFKTGKDWFPLPSYYDRAGWANLLGRDSASLVRRGEQYLGYQWKVIPATAYLDFERTGNRRTMENPQGANRGALISLMLAELAEGKGRFIDQILNGAWLATEQTSWVLSAHQPRQRTKRALPDARERFIDLGSGRYGAIIAIIHHFFHSEFDKIDPSVSIAIEDAVKRNILDPYLDIKERKANQWLGYYGGMINNWNPWCNSDAILCFLLMEKDQARLDAAVRQGIESIDMFLDYNTSDGACEEGPAYWDAAAGKLYDFLQILYDASSGKFAIFDNPRIKRMGEFISRSYIGDGFAANFADGSALATSTPEMVWAYGKAVRSKEMMDFALCRYADKSKGIFRSPHPVANEGYRAMNSARFIPEIARQTDSLNRILSAASEKDRPEAMERILGDLRKDVPMSTWYDETEMCFMRNSSGWFLGAKGGHNDESHNHNDIGTCIFSIRNIPVLVDAGVGTYTKATFDNKERYKIWAMRCEWHNLPMINGVQQEFGGKYKAADARCDIGKGRFSLELNKAYPDSAECVSWRREYILRPSGKPSLEITDTYSLKERVAADVWHYLVQGKVYLPGETCGKRKIKEGEILIENSHGEDNVFALLSFPAGLKYEVEAKVLDDAAFTKVWGERLYRITHTDSGNAPLKGKVVMNITEINPL